MANDEKNGVNLLSLSVEGLLKEAENAVIERDEGKLDDIEKLVKRFFCKKVVSHKLEEFDQFNKHMVNFLAWFEWGGEVKWDKKETIVIVNKWKTILELSQLISRSESPLKAYRELKKSSYGERLVTLLYEKKFMKPGEIQNHLNMGTIQQVSNLLSQYEHIGIIVKEFVGKNVWVSLGVQGMGVYNEFIEPKLSNMNHLTMMAFRIYYEENNFQRAKEMLEFEKEKDPKNPMVLCLLGLINLEEVNLYEAGMLFTEAAKATFDKMSIFLFYFILEKMKRLDLLKDGIWKINTQRDEISEQIRPSLRFLGMLKEYNGDTSRAKQYYEYSTKEV